MAAAAAATVSKAEHPSSVLMRMVVVPDEVGPLLELQDEVD